MGLFRTLSLSIALAGMAATGFAQSPPRVIRTFSQFSGTWTLDEAASTGRLTLAPLVITIETGPTEVRVAKQMGPRHTNRFPPPEIYRLDHTDTPAVDAATGVILDRIRRLTLVADMLALTTFERRARDRAFTLQTDAYELDGDTLQLHVQLVSVNADGQVWQMSEPTNNFRHTFLYRRSVRP